MKNIAIIVLLIMNTTGFSQMWDSAGVCNVNVNDPNFLNSSRNEIISSSVRLRVEGFCSGTLINRNTDDDDVGFYILTARHCIEGIDFNNTHTVYFNYQSPDENNNSTAGTNRGVIDWQSNTERIRNQGTFFEEIDTPQNGYEYQHISELRLVADYLWGDLALIEVLTPIPPHFNVTYSGWSPSRYYNGIQIGSGTTLPTLPSKYSSIHHPRGDIKKISGINKVLWLETPEATGCYAVTTTIDLLFGWIWSNTVSTQVICNYVDIPWMSVPTFQYGITEGGSSGSGIFNSGDQNIGVLSGGLSSCEFPVLEFYGKLHSNYSNADIKNVLNPNNDIWVDLAGLGSRKIECYDNLILPGANNVSGQYFPADHYQDENKIILQSNDRIETTQDIIIHNEADYEFVATNEIVLGPGFSTELGAEFIAKIEPCSVDAKQKTLSAQEQMITKLDNLNLPKSKKFSIEEYSENQSNIEIIKNSIKLLDNPNDGNFEIVFNANNNNQKVKMEIVDLQGKIIYMNKIMSNRINNISISNINSGLYFINIYEKNLVYSEKLMIK